MGSWHQTLTVHELSRCHMNVGSFASLFKQHNRKLEADMCGTNKDRCLREHAQHKYLRPLELALLAPV
jgi:hypothetical protein